MATGAFIGLFSCLATIAALVVIYHIEMKRSQRIILIVWAVAALSATLAFGMTKNQLSQTEYCYQAELVRNLRHLPHGEVISKERAWRIAEKVYHPIAGYTEIYQLDLRIKRLIAAGYGK